MIDFKTLDLNNGLKVILCQDHYTPMVAINLMYNVGARDENPEMTGLAHLFEHLMFSGSKNAPDYDKIVQNAGGENNAFTNNDVTNYYTLVPKENLEVALWIEADRMRDLNLNQKSLDVQKKVVIEEFKQRYFNQPYGELWLHLRPLCYQKHPYAWPTIGKSIEQIENVTLEDARAFYHKNYAPENCTLVVSGNFNEGNCIELINKYFAPIEGGEKIQRKYIQEDLQLEARKTEIKRDVPLNCLTLAFLAPGKSDSQYVVAELLTDILAGNNSSRLYQKLVKDQMIFTEISSYMSGECDPGLFIITGKLHPDSSYEKAEQKLWEEIEYLQQKGLKEKELLKVKNKYLTAEVYGELNILNRAMKLAFFQAMNELEKVNDTMKIVQAVSDSDVIAFAQEKLKKEKSNILYYSKN